jgi:pimeloyl-ACP methyl ester carboxylesterase
MNSATRPAEARSAPRSSRAPAEFVAVAGDGRTDRIEFNWIDRDATDRPLLVFLHEGLGSVAAWRDFPREVCAAAGCRGLVFSRVGYGASTPRAPHEKWPTDYLQRQAQRFLPALFTALGVDTRADPPWFYGHSDGGSIALIYAATFPDRIAGAVVAAPHIFVEEVTTAGIAAARELYRSSTELRARLARYHADPDSAFYGWNDAWHDPAFRAWNIEALLPAIRCPLTAIQGEGDEYATMAQIDGIARHVPHARLLKLPDCGHTPHRDQPAAVLGAILDVMRT